MRLRGIYGYPGKGSVVTVRRLCSSGEAHGTIHHAGLRIRRASAPNPMETGAAAGKALIAAGSATLAAIALRRLLFSHSEPTSPKPASSELASSKRPSPKSPPSSPGAPAWYVAPSLVFHGVFNVCIASVSHIPSYGVTPLCLRKLILGSTFGLWLIQHVDPYLERIGVPRSLMRKVYAACGFVVVPGLVLHNAALYCAFPPLQGTALVLLGMVIPAAYGLLYCAVSGSTQAPMTMDEISTHLHRNESWWVHALGDIAFCAYGCLVLALLPAEARAAYLGEGVRVYRVPPVWLSLGD